MTNKYTSTYNQCKKWGGCGDGLEYVLDTYGKKRFHVIDIAKYRLDWALWLLWHLDRKLLVKINCGFAKHVLHIFEGERPDDKRVRNYINVTMRWANGLATDDELQAVRGESARAARAARDAWAAWAAAGAAWAAWAAVAAWAAWAAVAARTAWAAVAARDARNKEIVWQLQYFIRKIKESDSNE